jgi:hypothetical protein
MMKQIENIDESIGDSDSASKELGSKHTGSTVSPPTKQKVSIGASDTYDDEDFEDFSMQSSSKDAKELNNKLAAAKKAAEAKKSPLRKSTEDDDTDEVDDTDEMS